MRAWEADDATVALGALRVEQDCSEARLGERVLALSYAQRRTLLILARWGGRIVPRDVLYEQAFGRPLGEDSRAVDTLILRIRRALGTAAGALVCVDRVGYRLDVERLGGCDDTINAIRHDGSSRAR